MIRCENDDLELEGKASDLVDEWATITVTIMELIEKEIGEVVTPNEMLEAVLARWMAEGKDSE